MSSKVSIKVAATAGLFALAGHAAATTLQDLPKGAHPGECFSHAMTPAVYRTERQPLPQPPLVTWRDIPAVYKTIDKQVLVAPGRVDRQFIPAVMGTRMHWVEHPGADRIVETAPVYRWEERRVMVSPARLEWKRGSAAQGYGDGGSGYGAAISVRPTGEVMCRVRVPARFEVRRVRVLVTPGRTCVVKGPSTRERIVEHFVVTPAHTIDHPVAPVYRTVSERVLVSPARKDRVVTPQPPRFIEKRVEVTPAHTGWTRINCAPPTAPQPRPHPHPATSAPAYGQPYAPTYAPQRPGELYGAPAQPTYHAPSAQQGYGSTNP